jgi:hypothetical protein
MVQSRSDGMGKPGTAVPGKRNWNGPSPLKRTARTSLETDKPHAAKESNGTHNQLSPPSQLARAVRESDRATPATDEF